MYYVERHVKRAAWRARISKLTEIEIATNDNETPEDAEKAHL